VALREASLVPLNSRKSDRTLPTQRSTAILSKPEPLCCPHFVEQCRFNQTNTQRTQVLPISSGRSAIYLTRRAWHIQLWPVDQSGYMHLPGSAARLRTSELRHHHTLSWLFSRLLVWPSTFLLYKALFLLHFSKQQKKKHALLYYGSKFLLLK